MTGTENLIHNIATVAFVLGRDDLSVRFVRDTFSEFALPTLLDGLLKDLEDSIIENGKWDVPLLINADMVATLMQVEIGTQVTVRRSSNSVNALSQRQWLTMI